MPTAATEAGSVTSVRDEPRRAVMRQVAAMDVGDDDLVAVGDQFWCEMAADETVAAENDMSH